MLRRIYNIIRSVAATLLILLVTIPAALYVVLSTPWAQEKLCAVAQDELTKLLGTEVTIGSVEYLPFDQIAVYDAKVNDDYGTPCLDVKSIQGHFELWTFLTKGRIIIDYAVIDELNAKTYRQTPDSPLNIAGIIDKLQPKDKDKPPSRINLAIRMAEIKNSGATYDVLSAPRRVKGFDKNHIKITDLDVFALLPCAGNEKVEVDIKHLSFNEQSGFALSNLTSRVRYTHTSLDLSDVAITLPQSKVMLGNYALGYTNPGELANVIKNRPLDIAILKDSYLTLSDIAAFVPKLSDINRRFYITADAELSFPKAKVRTIEIEEVTDGGLSLRINGNIAGLNDLRNLSFTALKTEFTVYPGSLLDLIKRFDITLPSHTAQLLKEARYLKGNIEANGSMTEATAKIDLKTALGNLYLDCQAKSNTNHDNVEATFETRLGNVNLGKLASDDRLGILDANAGGTLAWTRGKTPWGNVWTEIIRAKYAALEVMPSQVHADLDKNGSFNGKVGLCTNKGAVEMTFDGSIAPDDPRLALNGKLDSLDLYATGITKSDKSYKLSAVLDADLRGELKKWVEGYVNIHDIDLLSDNADYRNLHIDHLDLTASTKGSRHTLELGNDFINGNIQGRISFYTLPAAIRAFASKFVPAFVAPVQQALLQGEDNENVFTYEFEINHTASLSEFFDLPVEIVYPVSIDGSLNSVSQHALFALDAPYIQKGENIIEHTSLQLVADSLSDTGRLYYTSQFPTKKGDMTIKGLTQLRADSLDTQIDWHIERQTPIGGILSFSNSVGRDVDGQPFVTMEFKPSDITFGNDTWHINPSRIDYKKNSLKVDDFTMTNGSQLLGINGINDPYYPDREIVLTIKDLQLVQIFETLDINKALIGGTANGTFHISNLLGGSPMLATDDLHVDDIGYNYCVLGDADLSAHWDNNEKAFYLDADITEPGGEHSRIWGNIYPMTESLDINFDAHDAKVGFMKPFINAFAGDITGYVTGKARLFGTFKYIDMEGDIYARDLGIKIDFTNTWYYTSDSLHLEPGIIAIDNVTVKDEYGNPALLNGWVKHTFFKDPAFDFKVTDAKGLLCYDVTSQLSPDWYGRIFGNGSASITGYPGTVNIGVNMTTTPGSTFTFVLSDMNEATDYTFLKFRDKAVLAVKDTLELEDRVPAVVREYQQRKLAQKNQIQQPSAYNMDIQVDITPDARMTLVMDPVGGDEVRAYGNGHLRMTYTSLDNDLKMYGTYAIDRGSYNFTLQDIILKDFVLRPGSSISFLGDPYSARLYIKAAYALTANLSDLDESFMQDKELNRTRVPVEALLNVTGDMRQPDISFDLAFPTLQSDVYRKVRSIISTDDMMNRQILYLLALNRFYTPDYMNATKGNELFSVASSTISSRLGDMLGKLNENLTISPTLRSDKGDFSDVEFDLALSSTLLNNRLRLNGNFGYRDKSLNTNQFIGDFDAEYLLNKSGVWRLKAYNRYNDQNYYLRSAQTTQGVGIMFRRDFDDLFRFLKPKRAKVPDCPDQQPDSVPGH